MREQSEASGEAECESRWERGAGEAERNGGEGRAREVGEVWAYERNHGGVFWGRAKGNT